jgi:hypothetical protein
MVNKSPAQINMKTFYQDNDLSFQSNLIEKNGWQFNFYLKFNSRYHRYPKHMHIQMQVMEGKLRTVDLILEVHDGKGLKINQKLTDVFLSYFSASCSLGKEFKFCAEIVFGSSTHFSDE